MFRIHAETSTSPPFACLNDLRGPYCSTLNRVFDGQHIKKGVNLVSLNGTTGDVESTASFDVTASDGDLINWLRFVLCSSMGWLPHEQRSLVFRSLPSSSIIMGVSFGDVAERVSADARAALSSFGAVRIADWRGSSSYAILGQHGLQEHAHELRLKRHCALDEISMYFFTGEHKDDWPRLCVGGRMVFDKGLNGAGRGLNLASIEPKTGRVSAVAHFDTYQDESTALEEWLENVPLGDVMAVVSFDEASNM
ncbi:unnamed protein product [Heligmosomoides polygyrus]|uniref:ILEI/PANDER domain-containing protein n=1 Tax=Heligmosomoides polygyrus TaxID=6339 RepID=A0A3P7WP48_HELPZ|nr:unnamed protein product [Heligmosomoides polygyrus]